MTTYIEGQKLATPYTGNTLYVNTESGDDVLNNGESSGAPLGTIQAAIDRFLPSYLPPQAWDSDVTKRIVVQYTPGMSAIRENINKPAHREGLLVIEAEELEVYSLSQNGAAAAVDGYESLWQVNVTGATIPSTLPLDGYFMATADDVVFGNEVFTYLDSFVIVETTSSSLLFPANNIGVSDGFGLGDGNTIRVLTPQIVWQDFAKTGGTFGPNPPQIVNMGGPLQIKGFEFNPDSTFSSIYFGHPGPDNATLNSSTIFTRCLFKTDNVGVGGYYLVDGGHDINLSGCKVETTASRPVNIRNVDVTSIQRSFYGLNGNSAGITSVSRATLNYLYIKEEAASSTNHFTVSNIGSGSIFSSDFRGGPELLCNAASSRFSIERITFSGCNSNCVELTGPGLYSLSELSGSDNAGYGVIMFDSAQVTSISSVTVTGSLGDLKVGDAPAADWADVPIVDLATGCRAVS